MTRTPATSIQASGMEETFIAATLWLDALVRLFPVAFATVAIAAEKARTFYVRRPDGWNWDSEISLCEQLVEDGRDEKL